MAKHVVPRSAGTREERFWLHVDKSAGPDACWSWVGAKIGKQGAFKWDGKVGLAYEIAFILANGPLPDGTSTRLHCGNNWCCNPAHAERIDGSRKTRRPRGSFASKAEAAVFYRESDREKHNASRRLQRQKDIARDPALVKRREAARAARVRLKGSDTFTASDVADIFRLQKGRCAICRLSINAMYDVDHIVPLAKGGTNARRNIQLLCPRCNLKKHAQDPIDFMRKLGRLL